MTGPSRTDLEGNSDQIGYSELFLVYNLKVEVN